MTKINWDQEIYLPVFSAARNNTIGVHETGSNGWSKEALVQDIFDGQIENVIAVIYANPVEEVCRIVTDDIIDEVCAKILESDHKGGEGWLPPLVDTDEFRTELAGEVDPDPVKEHGILHVGGGGVLGR